MRNLLAILCIICFLLFPWNSGILSRGSTEEKTFDSKAISALIRDKGTTTSPIALSILLNKRQLSLRELFVLDNLFNDSDLLDKNTTSLKDLLILDSIFNDKKLFRGNNLSINDLILIDNLLGNGNGLLDPDKTSLEDIIILDQLFGK